MQKFGGFLKTPYVAITLVSILFHFILLPLATLKYLTIYYVFVMFAITSGIVEGILWSRKGAEAFKWNEHIALISQAIAFILGVSLSQFVRIPFFHFGILLLASSMAFVGIKPGVMYYVRHKIDPSVYGAKFFAEPSDSSTAKINLSVALRMGLIVCSIEILSILIFYGKVY